MDEGIFVELKRYVQFGTDDEGYLRAFAPLARPHFKSIVGRFYDRVLDHEDARSVFKDTAQVKRLRTSLMVWLGSLLAGPWDNAYHEGRSRIGYAHVRVGLPQRYMLSAMNVIRDSLLQLASTSARGNETDRTVSALNKVMDLDLALMLETYREASIDEVREQGRKSEAQLAAVAGGLAHEIRNPLNAAHLQLMLATKRLEASKNEHYPQALEQSSDAVRIASNELKRVANLVGDFLLFARPQTLSIQHKSLINLIQQVIDLLQIEAHQKHVQIVFQPSSNEVNAWIDEDRIKQVLINVLRNAIEASPDGRDVVVKVMSNQGTPTIQVLDSGAGFSLGLGESLQPFVTTKDHGTGLGLAIVQRIVRDHQGRFDMRREDGTTVVEIVLNHEP